MKKILVILFVIIPGIKATYADTWARPVEKDYYSENRMFVAHVTPAKKEIKPELEVFKIEDSGKTPLWQCTLGNEGAPQDVFVSDDGQYVVTIDEVNARVHGGFGDYVVAFYNEAGVINNYSLEQVLHYPEDINEQEFRRLTSRSISGRSWAYRPMFFDKYGQKLYFCVWLIYEERWLAWEVDSGKEVKINDKMRECWNKKGWLWAREYGIKSKYYDPASRFLGKLKKIEDRPIIESLLASNDFYTDKETKRGKFIRFYCWSSRRALAERILVEWDVKPAQRPSRSNQQYYYLGVVEGTVELPQPPKAGDGWLCIYLVPDEVVEENWYTQMPIHRLTTYFWEYSFHNCRWPGNNIHFRIQGVTPGKYRVKAVWDKAKPYNFEDNYITGPPQQGDYQNIDSPIITVRAGETVKNVAVDCTIKVTDGAD